MARLSEEARAELERRVEVLRMELRLVEAELRGDEALRVQEGARERAGAGVIVGGYVGVGGIGFPEGGWHRCVRAESSVNHRLMFACAMQTAQGGMT
jgi:hypothetical protein